MYQRHEGKKEKRVEYEMVQDTGKEGADGALEIAAQNTLARNDVLAVGAQVVHLMPNVQLGVVFAGVFSRFVQAHKGRVFRIHANDFLGFVRLVGGEQRCQTASDIAATGNRTQVVESPEDPPLYEALHDPQAQSRRANTAAGKANTS